MSSCINLQSLKSWIVLMVNIELCICGYNLIDTNPSCYQKNICPFGIPGGSNSIHPNSEERTTYTLRNIARLYPTDYINGKYGKHVFGTFGERTTFYDGADKEFCGIAAQRPMYWHSAGNQLARYREWDAAHCDNSDIGHSTCPQRCNLFIPNDCSFTARSHAFVGDDGASATSEGLWGANMGYESGHCGALFDPQHTYHGVGFWPGSNNIAAVYIANGPYIDHPLVQGAHFDERIKMNSADYFGNRQYLTFIVQYYGADDLIVSGNGNFNAKDVYLLYDGNYHTMNLEVGTALSGFYELHFLIPTQCKPYAFFVVNDNDNIYRLPEDEEYFFGTAWTEWDWWKPDNPCNENHYYYDGNVWKPNTSDQYNGNNNNECIGCNEIDQLVTIYNSFKNNIGTISTTAATVTTTTTLSATGRPTNKPTNKPIQPPTEKLTQKPTPKPTNKPTNKPTITPTNELSQSPTAKPSIKPTIFPTKSPTNKPSETPTIKLTERPTINPILRPTVQPTDKPTETPTDNDSDTFGGIIYVDCRTKSCVRKRIFCGNNDHCFIDCSYNNEACQDSEIYCPDNENYECMVECMGSEACDRMRIYAINSKILTLSCHDYDEVCHDMHVYCPHNMFITTDGISDEPCCYINGHNDFDGMNIYASNGFIDIQFDVEEIMGTATIHCETGACQIESVYPYRACKYGENVCNAQIKTTRYPNNPISSPTPKPTENVISSAIQQIGSNFDCTNTLCKDGILICEDNIDCWIDCGYRDGEACQNIIIHCPKNAKCIVFCGGGSESCERANIYAQKSDTLYLICEDYEEACYEMNIYCPHNERKSCDISGYNDFFGMNIYTINGLNNLFLSIENSLPAAIVHCGDKYSNSCHILNQYPYDKCDNDSICNAVLAQPPTNNITPSPTRNRRRPRRWQNEIPSNDNDIGDTAN